LYKKKNVEEARPDGEKAETESQYSMLKDGKDGRGSIVFQNEACDHTSTGSYDFFLPHTRHLIKFSFKPLHLEQVCTCSKSKERRVQ